LGISILQTDNHIFSFKIFPYVLYSALGIAGRVEIFSGFALIELYESLLAESYMSESLAFGFEGNYLGVPFAVNGLDFSLEHG